MFKRLWKNVILAVCCLALVLQPIAVFAQDYYITEERQFVYTLNQKMAGTFFGVYSDYSNVASAVVDFQNDLSRSEYSSDLDNCIRGWYVYMFSLGTLLCYPIQDMIISSYSTTNATANFNSYRYMYRNGTLQKQTNAPYSQPLYASGVTGTTLAFNIYSDNICSVNFVNDDEIYYYDRDYDPSSYQPDIPPIVIDNPTTVSGGNYPLNIYMQLGLMFALNFNCYTPDGSVHFNPNWVGVGYALTYDYLCKTNKDSETVTVYLADGTPATLPNYLYAEDPPDYSTVLASIDSKLSTNNSTLSTISSRVNTTNSRLNTINSSINNQMNAVNSRLEIAFPDDQAEINDSIADQILDDTNDTGLTVNRITSAKSDLDAGISTFKLDTSGSQYSNPFSALSDADWSFWSQTTLNNLGSGYSYSFGGGSLMSEDDVFTENQNTLLDLLGW